MSVWCSIPQGCTNSTGPPVGQPGTALSQWRICFNSWTESQKWGRTGKKGLHNSLHISRCHSRQGLFEPLLKCTPRIEARRGRGDICQQNSKECFHTPFLNLTLILSQEVENYDVLSVRACGAGKGWWLLNKSVGRNYPLPQTNGSQGLLVLWLLVRSKNKIYNKQGLKSYPHLSICSLKSEMQLFLLIPAW